MDIFLTLFLKILPLYALILLGFIAGKFLHVKKESIAPILIYIVAPVIVFNGVITTHLSPNILSLPLLFLIICSCMCLVFHVIASKIWHDSTKNIFAFAVGTGNTGYFGLPVALAIFDTHVLGIVVLSLLGFILYENTVGFFTVAKGHHTVEESIKKVLTLPTVYAFLLGIIINILGLHLGSIYADAAANFKGAYTILGMMIIGLGLSSIDDYKFDVTFIGLTFFAKFLVWPIIIFSLIFLDNAFFHFYTVDMHKVMVLMSIVPLAANTVSFATQLKTQPEKAALAVLLSTLFALVYIPIMVVYFLK